MNIEALTADLNRVFQQHGITGNLQICMQVAFSATLAEDSRRELLERLSAGGALFVIDDAGSISCAGARESVNATRTFGTVTNIPATPCRRAWCTSDPMSGSNRASQDAVGCSMDWCAPGIQPKWVAYACATASA